MIAARFLVSLLALPIAGTIAQVPDRASEPVSLVVAGHWRGVTVVGTPPCPADIPEDEECLSLNVIADVRLGNVRTLAGPRVPTIMTARFEFHADPAPGAQQVLLVRRARDRARFDAISLGRVRAGSPICVSRDALTGNSLTVPRRARVTGEMVCFRR